MCNVLYSKLFFTCEMNWIVLSWKKFSGGNWVYCGFQLEQMDLEVREIPIQSRPMYNSRLKSYKGEIEKLEKDFVSTHTPASNFMVI